MIVRTPSWVFLAGTAIHELLTAVEWEITPANPDGPIVQFGDFDAQGAPGREVVGIVGVMDDGTSEWVTLGKPSREERFRVRVLIRVVNLGLSGAEAWERLGVLAGQVHAALRDLATGKPIIPDAVLMTHGVGVYAWAASKTHPQIIPVTDGYDGVCAVDIEVQARL